VLAGLAAQVFLASEWGAVAGRHRQLQLTCLSNPTSQGPCCSPPAASPAGTLLCDHHIVPHVNSRAPLQFAVLSRAVGAPGAGRRSSSRRERQRRGRGAPNYALAEEDVEWDTEDVPAPRPRQTMARRPPPLPRDEPLTG
jgi:hypothetical protein